MFAIGRTHHFYHAPWSRWFRTFYLRGNWAHELQIGPVVFQVRRLGDAGRRWRKTWSVWTTPYWK